MTNDIFIEHYMHAKLSAATRRRLESEAEIEAQKNNPGKQRGKGGKHRGARAFVRIVKLLLEFSLTDLTKAITTGLYLGHPEYEVIRSYCYPEESSEIEVFTLEGREHLKSYEVKIPQLESYNYFLMEDTNGQVKSIAGKLSERSEAFCKSRVATDNYARTYL